MLYVDSMYFLDKRIINVLNDLLYDSKYLKMGKIWRRKNIKDYFLILNVNFLLFVIFFMGIISFLNDGFK